MAKEKKTAENTTITVENVYESLNNAVVASDNTLPAKVLEEIKKESDENTIRQMKCRFQKGAFNIEHGYLKLRRDKEITKVRQSELTMLDRLGRFMMGFTVTPEVIEHAKHHNDTLFNMETVDVKAETITITKDGKATTYKKGDEVPACIDYVDYDKMLDKMKEDVRKRINDEEKKYDEYYDKLRAKYNQYWDRSWWY